jgi:hypothetical protein
MDVDVGARLRSTVCDTEVIVVRSPGGEVDVRCGGYPMVAKESTAAAAGDPKAGLDGGTLLGKRYGDEDLGIEVLATKAGAGTLSVGDDPLAVKQPKVLPSSD